MIRTHFSVCILLWVALPAEANPVMHPVLRYAVYEGDRTESEYLGASDGPFIDHFRQLPVADGPMEVDCRTVSELGIVIEPIGVGSWIYGANRKYRFRWEHSSEPPASVTRMQYRRNTPHGFLRNSVKPDNWLVDGTIRLTITVEGKVVYQTLYKLINCDANIYRTPVPPSERRVERDKNNDVPEGPTSFQESQ